ncbi:MAG: hypothetical protein IPM16_00475 [Chloroflexi bacterium]|nr:hypothetical protein [Chloroflexota bacterium]
MKRRSLSIITLVALFLLSAAALRSRGDAQDVGDRTGIRPDAPAYAIRGPYTAGARSISIDADGPLEATVWYPAVGEESGAEYSYVIKMDMLAGMTASAVGQAAVDAPADESGGPYPLVILSPGFAIGRASYAWMGEHLSTHGFIVIAPEHVEAADEALSGFWRAAITRPQEVHSVLEYVDAETVEGGSLHGLVDAETVAVIGHSYGGYTSLVMGGARFDIDSMNALCESARAEGDPVGAWLCDLVEPFVGDMAELSGLDSIPDGLWPARGDDRIDAIVPMAGDAYFFNADGLAAVDVPVLAIGGTADTGTPYLWGAYPTYEHVSSDTKARVAFEHAEHMVFASTCESLPFFAEIGFYTFCSDAVWDVDRVHDLTNHFTTAFLLSVLKGDEDAAAALAPEAVQFAGITYDALGF